MREMKRMPAGTLASEGTLTRNHVSYQYSSLPATAYPSGAARIYLQVIDLHDLDHLELIASEVMPQVR